MSDRGYVTVPFIMLVAVTLIGFVAVVNLFAVHYARGVLQTAVEEGARQGIAVGSADACAGRIDEILTTGLGGLRDGVGAPSCAVGPRGASASIGATFTPWLPALPAQSASATAIVAAPSVGP